MSKENRLTFIDLLTRALQVVFAPWSNSNTVPTWNGSIATVIVNKDGGDGSTPAHAIRITTPAELAYLAQQVNNRNKRVQLAKGMFHRNVGEGFANTWFRLTNDINLNGHPWVPIGTGSATDGAPSFCGTFDGGGYKVSGLFIPHATSIAGLFGFIGRYGCIQNVHVSVPQIINSPDSYIGAVAGWNDGIIRHCITSGAGTVNGGHAGGITGTNTNRVQNCYSTLSVKGENSGGIVAFNSADTLACCYATGCIFANETAGGIAAGNGTNGVIKHCAALNTKGISTVADNHQHAGRITNDSEGILTSNFASPIIPGNWYRPGATCNDGTEFAVRTFHSTSNPADPFDRWSTTAWHFDPQNIHLPALRTTDGQVIDHQPVLIRTDYTS